MMILMQYFTNFTTKNTQKSSKKRLKSYPRIANCKKERNPEKCNPSHAKTTFFSSWGSSKSTKIHKKYLQNPVRKNITFSSSFLAIFASFWSPKWSPKHQKHYTEKTLEKTTKKGSPGGAWSD